jgi:hypothetical protein
MVELLRSGAQGMRRNARGIGKNSNDSKQLHALPESVSTRVREESALVAEGDPALRRFGVARLGELNYRAVCAGDGEEALTALGRQVPSGSAEVLLHESFRRIERARGMRAVLDARERSGGDR